MSKCVLTTPASLVGMASKDDSLLKIVEQHGVYTITYATETEDAFDISDGEAESECEAGSLASYDDVENEELELLEGLSDDKYFGKLERRDLYRLRYFDEPEQDDKDVDEESEGGSKYDVSMMRYVDVAASDGECRSKRFVERNRTFINAHCDGIKRDLQQPEEAKLGESDCNAISGACCVLPDRIVQRKGSDVWFDRLQASSCDHDGQRSTYVVHQTDQDLEFYAGFSEIGGRCMWAEYSKEGGNTQLRASGILATVRGDSHTPETIAEPPLGNVAYYPTPAQPAIFTNAHFPDSYRYVSGPGDSEKGRSHNQHAEAKTPSTQLDGSLDLHPQLSPTCSILSSTGHQLSFPTRKSFQEITQRLLSTSSTRLLPLLSPSDSTLEPRKYNPDSSSTESLSTSAMNPLYVYKP